MAYLYNEGTQSSDTVYLLSWTRDTLTVQLANDTSETYQLTADHHLNLELGHSDGMLTVSLAYGSTWDTSSANAVVQLGDTGSPLTVPCSFSALTADSKLHITVASGATAETLTILDPKICVIPPTRSGGGHDLES
jgi:hypothetical protein